MLRIIVNVTLAQWKQGVKVKLDRRAVLSKIVSLDEISLGVVLSF